MGAASCTAPTSNSATTPGDGTRRDSRRRSGRSSGWHLKAVDVIFNPILDTSYDGFGQLVFAPSVRVARTVSPVWAVALEEYADFGPLHHLHSRVDQAHQLYGVVDRAGKQWDVEAGVGFGLTRGSDDLTLKLIVARDLTSFKRTK